LPLFPAMRDEDVDRVCTEITRVIKSISKPTRVPDAAVASRG
jgi:hypothetical protein